MDIIDVMAGTETKYVGNTQIIEARPETTENTRSAKEKGKQL